MKGKIVLIATLTVLLTAFLNAQLNPFYGTLKVAKATQTFVEMLWNSTMTVRDVAVSGDSEHIAAVNYSGIFYFDSDNSTSKWWFLLPNTFMSIAISADGEYVVAGDHNGYLYYFNESTSRANEQTSTTWNSTYLGGSIERGTLDMSDDGDYIVVGGTGVSLYYFAGCTARTVSTEPPTWFDILNAWDVLAVDISSDGRYIAAGGTNSSGGFVAFYKNANATHPAPPSQTEPDWDAWSSTNHRIGGLEVSDDGYAVAAIDVPSVETLYYWANSKTLTGDPSPTWTNDNYFTSVDMSADGNNVIAGTIPAGSLHFWANARARQGPQTENWTELETATVTDVAINDDGSIIAASAEEEGPTYKAYFFKSDGTMIDEFDLLESSPIVSMSEDGSIVAFGGGVFDSLYVFKITTDSTPPAINSVYQQPSKDNVHPENMVMVYANVTDDYSGVKQVTLNYTTGNGTWFTVTMTNLQPDIWNATVLPFPYCTTITYIIIAEDKANNTITTQQMEQTHQYHVIPEFLPTIALSLFMATTLLSAMICRRKRTPKLQTNEVT